MDCLEIFACGKYDRDMQILKILASNSKQFRVYGIFKKWQIDDDRGGSQIQHFLRLLLLKITDGLQISHDYVFWHKKFKNGIWNTLKPTGTVL